MAVLYSKEKGKLGTLTGSIINWSKQLTSSDPTDPTIYQTLPAGYLRCDGGVYLAENFPELATILGVGSTSRYKKPDTNLLDNQFQVPDLGAKSTKTSFSANLGDYQDTYLLNDAAQEITKSGVGLEVSSNIGASYTIQYQGNFFLPSQTIEITGQPGFSRSSGNYTEETEVLATAFQPHAHFHDGYRSRTASPTGEFSLFGRNSYVSKSSLCIMPWANNTRQELCKASASKSVAAGQQRVRSNNCLFGSETYTWFGACWQGCDFEQNQKCLIPGNIAEQDLQGTPTGNILQFGCATEAIGTSFQQSGFPIYIRSGSPAFKADCGNIEYTSEASCKGGEGSCFPGSASCNNFSQIGNGPIHSRLDANYFDTQVPFDAQPSEVSYGALNNTVTDVEEFGNECIHKHFVPFNQDPHTFNVVTKPTYIPASEIVSTLQIDVNEENKADGYIQPFLIQEFLIKY
jgi:hypothetical protein